MYKAIDVARMVIWLTDDEHGGIVTNLKLQKLLYYLQGFWLAGYGRPLFEDAVEAWGYGPVVPSVYFKFKRYGRSPIDVDLEGRELRLETKEEEAFFYNVYETFAQYDTSALVHMTHQEFPWCNAEGIGRGHVIRQEDMKSYFKTRLED